jgi:hypothetical protein
MSNFGIPTGTAGTANAAVVTVQGIASGTAIAISAASLPLPTGAATSAKQDTIIGHVDGIETLLGTIDAVIDTIKTDTAALVTDAAAIEVLLTGIDADTDAIKTAVQLLDNAISGDEMQVDIVAALPAGTNNIGDVDVASITNASINGPGVPVIDSYGSVAINLAAGANQVLVSSAANKQIWVYGYHIMVNVAGTVSFQDEDDTAKSGIMPFADNGGATVHPSGNFAMPIWKLATDKDLEVDVVTSELDGWLSYAIVSV